MKRFGGAANHDVRKPSSGAPSKSLNTTAAVEKPKEAEPSAPKMDWPTKAPKIERRVMAAGESAVSKKDGALPPLPPMSRSQINEFIKLYFPPGFPLPK